MSLTESRLTRTSAATGTAARARSRHVGDDRSRAAAPGARRRVVGRGVWRAPGAGIAAAAEWSARTVRPAGVLVVLAAHGGARTRDRVRLGRVDGRGRVAVLLLVASIPFLFGARSYDVDVAPARTSGSSPGGGVTGEVQCATDGRRIALPGRIDIPVGDRASSSSASRCCAPTTPSRSRSTIPALRRGVVNVGPATTVRSDPIGLLRREHAFETSTTSTSTRARGLPSTSAGLIRDLEGSPTRRLVDADMSFHAIREYAPGDSRRQIHWKSTAKTGRLMVRQYEESRRSRMAVVLGVAAAEYADDDEFELAVELRGVARCSGPCATRRTSRSSPGRRSRAWCGAGSAPSRTPSDRRRARCSTASAALDRLESTMPVAEVCRLTAESASSCRSRSSSSDRASRLTRLQQAALAFPADTTVVGGHLRRARPPPHAAAVGRSPSSPSAPSTTSRGCCFEGAAA